MIGFIHFCIRASILFPFLNQLEVITSPSYLNLDVLLVFLSGDIYITLTFSFVFEIHSVYSHEICNPVLLAHLSQFYQFSFFFFWVVCKITRSSAKARSIRMYAQCRILQNHGYSFLLVSCTILLQLSLTHPQTVLERGHLEEIRWKEILSRVKYLQVGDRRRLHGYVGYARNKIPHAGHNINKKPNASVLILSVAARPILGGCVQIREFIIPVLMM